MPLTERNAVCCLCLQLIADYEAKLGPAPDSVRAFFTGLAE